MEQSIVQMAAVVIVAFSLLFVFGVGLVVIYNKVRSYSRLNTGNILTKDQAEEIKTQLASVDKRLKKEAAK